jgi:hypothetical protein
MILVVVVAIVVGFLATACSTFASGDTSIFVVASVQERAYGRVAAAFTVNALFIALPIAYVLGLVWLLFA